MDGTCRLMREVRNAYAVLIILSHRKRPLGGFDIKMDHCDLKCEDVD
jgi:hypothetical protein